MEKVNKISKGNLLERINANNIKMIHLNNYEQFYELLEKEAFKLPEEQRK